MLNDYSGVIHRSILFQNVNDTRYCGVLLADRLETFNTFSLLVKDRIDGDGGLARFTVPND